MATFKEQRADTFYDLVLDAGVFAEVVTYTSPPAAGRQVYGKKVENESDLLEQQFQNENMELLLMRFGRNEAHVKGGVAAPKSGDTIVRAGDTVPYAFSGKILKTTPHSWTLVFARPLQQQAG